MKVHQLGRQRNTRLQPISHANFEDSKKTLHQLKFLRKCRLGLTRAGERGAQVGDEFFKHALRVVWLAVNQAGDVSQRVEQKVRLNLRLQGAQIGLRGRALGRFRPLTLFCQRQLRAELLGTALPD